VSTHLFTYLFGARVPYRRWEKFTPYAQLLFGRAHVEGSVMGVSESDTESAIALGLGADYRITERLAWRVQADYLRTRFFSYYEDNYRVSTGIVLNFTHKKKRRTLTTP
jgi:opacity protein-like surface antigen